VSNLQTVVNNFSADRVSVLDDRVVQFCNSLVWNHGWCFRCSYSDPGIHNGRKPRNLHTATMACSVGKSRSILQVVKLNT
jgi:hypothetical protein